jgi:hypothetical protein
MLGTGQPSDLFSLAAQQYTQRSNPMKDLLLAPESKSAVVLARPNYLAPLTPRSDPFANTGSIRGTFAPIEQTAVHPSALMSSQETVRGVQVAREDGPRSILSAVPPVLHKESYSEKKEKILISPSTNKNTMAQQRPVLELIDDDSSFVQQPLSSSNFSRLGEIDQPVDCAVQKKAVSDRPDLSFFDPKQLLPKSDIRSCFKDPQDPSNYMYDRSLFAPLKRRYNTGVDFVRGDLYIAPNRFGWFDTPANPGTDLNPGFFNLNYPSFEQSISLQDTQVERKFPSLKAAQVEQMQFGNPYDGQVFRRGP